MKIATTLTLPPSAGNPRNSEGAFADLGDGRLLFLYTRYCGESWGDDAVADLVARYSDDNGRSWGEDQVLFAHDEKALNLMSVSLLRLQDGRLMLAYLRKSPSVERGVDSMPYVCFSGDEGASWSEPRPIAPFPGYHVLNNDRVIQLPSGRIIVPVAWHRPLTLTSHDYRAIALFLLSDDGGETFREAADWVLPPQHCGSGLQEPGVISLGDDKVMAYFRTDLGCHYRAFSEDGGDHWSVAEPTGFIAPCSPLCMKRRPSTGELFAVWNDRSDRWNGLPKPEESSWGRTPFVLARSDDDGKSWQGHELLESDPARGYCYAAIHFTKDDALLLAFCDGGRDCAVLAETKVVRIELA